VKVASLVAGLAALTAALAGGHLAHADDAACIAANEEALSLRKQGKLRESLRPLAVCADPGCPAEVKAECAQRITDVKAALPTLTFVIKDRRGNDLTGVRVTMDGGPLPGALDGQPIPLDPGEHAFRFEAPGQPPMDRKLILVAGEKDRRESVVLGAPPPPGFWTPPRAVAAALTGVGVVGIGLGAVFTAYAASAKSKENTDCTAAACLNYAQAVEDYNTATRNATGSTVAFVVGGILAGAGVVLFIAAPRPKAALVTNTGASLRLSPLFAGPANARGAPGRPVGGLSLGGSF
jgi:hypothetical protein